MPDDEVVQELGSQALDSTCQLARKALGRDHAANQPPVHVQCPLHAKALEVGVALVAGVSNVAYKKRRFSSERN